MHVVALSVLIGDLHRHCGQVLAVGGGKKASGRESDPTDNVYMYDPSMDTWTVIGHVPTPRYKCHVAVLPDNTFLVVGGAPKGCFMSDMYT